MIPVEEALAIVLDHVPVPRVEQVPTLRAIGRVLARDLVAPADIPAWDNSAMDGYAVRSADAELALDVVEAIGAGTVADGGVGPGQAIGITTGAPLPAGADAVVPVERVTHEDGRIRIDGAVRAGDHVRRAGEDVPRGSAPLRAGDVLTPARAGLAASLGLAELPVARRPVVSLLVTGDELVLPGQPLPPGALYSSNDVVLHGMLEEAGAICRPQGNVHDDRAALRSRLEHALVEADAVVTTGGVSVGAYDHVKGALQDLGARIVFWKVAIKPGKPMVFALVEREGRTVPVFGLPGNPAACAVVFLQLVRPWLRAALGDRRPRLPVLDVVLGEDVSGRPGRTRYQRVALAREDGRIVARRAGAQGSGRLSSVADGHALLVLDADVESLSAGAVVQVQLLDPTFATPG